MTTTDRKYRTTTTQESIIAATTHNIAPNFTATKPANIIQNGATTAAKQEATTPESIQQDGGIYLLMTV